MKDEFTSKYQAKEFAREMIKAVVWISLGTIIGFMIGVVA